MARQELPPLPPLPFQAPVGALSLHLVRRMPRARHPPAVACRSFLLYRLCLLRRGFSGSGSRLGRSGRQRGRLSGAVWAVRSVDVRSCLRCHPCLPWTRCLVTACFERAVFEGSLRCHQLTRNALVCAQLRHVKGFSFREPKSERPCDSWAQLS